MAVLGTWRVAERGNTSRYLRFLLLGVLTLVVLALQAQDAPPVSAETGTAVSAGYGHSCALTTAGGVKCWGNNGASQLGGESSDMCGYWDSPCSTTPVDVSALASGVAAVAAGFSHTCSLTAAGGVKCWGYNWDGELGDGKSCGNECTTPVDVSGLNGGAAAVAAGGSHTCAVTAGGGVKCWGSNWAGQLGDGTTGERWTPVDVTGLTSGVAAVSAGGWGHTCAVTTADGVKCWGSNVSGQLGDGQSCDTSYCTAPVDVAGLTSGMAAVVAGGYHTCALTAAGVIKCWGKNESGQLGDGTTMDRTTPSVDVLNPGPDSDGDGVFDAIDNCPDTPNPDEENVVHPGTPAGDHCEDPDSDTVMDISDNCPDTPNPGQENGDGDPVGDACDNCPSDTNPGQENDVHPTSPAGDHCEDPDSDTVMDISDNCPDTPNVGQENIDGDQWGDVCDTCPSVPPWWRVVPEGDDDCDGFTTDREVYLGTDPGKLCAETSIGSDEDPPDAWPVDFNDDQRPNMQDVIFAFVTTLVPLGLNQPAVDPLVRVDLNGDGFISMQDVILGYVTMLAPSGLSTPCAP